MFALNEGGREDDAHSEGAGLFSETEGNFKEDDVGTASDAPTGVRTSGRITQFCGNMRYVGVRIPKDLCQSTKLSPPMQRQAGQKRPIASSGGNALLSMPGPIDLVHANFFLVSFFPSGLFFFYRVHARFRRRRLAFIG